MARTFETIKVVAVEAAKKEGWNRVQFEQEVHTNGNEASPNGLGLMSAVNGFTDKRTCYENVSSEVMDKLGLKEGAELKGFNIARYRHEIPVSDNHKAGGNGKFYTTKLVAEGQPTDYEVALEVSQKMYDDWKAATSAVSSEATTSNAAAIQSIVD